MAKEQRWHGDWNAAQPDPDPDAERRFHARDLTWKLLMFGGSPPSRVITLVTDTFGEVGREEAKNFIERWIENGRPTILYG
jgi:hypothetical protein